MDLSHHKLNEQIHFNIKTERQPGLKRSGPDLAEFLTLNAALRLLFDVDLFWLFLAFFLFSVRPLPGATWPAVRPPPEAPQCCQDTTRKWTANIFFCATNARHQRPVVQLYILGVVSSMWFAAHNVPFCLAMQNWFFLIKKKKWLCVHTLTPYCKHLTLFNISLFLCLYIWVINIMITVI